MTSPLTPSDLERLEQCARGMTPGKREAQAFERSGDPKPWFRWRIFLRGASNPATNSRDCDWTEGDAKAIAALDKKTVLALIAPARKADALEAAVRELFILVDRFSPRDYVQSIEALAAAESRLRTLATSEDSNGG